MYQVFFILLNWNLEKILILIIITPSAFCYKIQSLNIVNVLLGFDKNHPVHPVYAQKPMAPSADTSVQIKWYTLPLF